MDGVQGTGAISYLEEPEEPRILERWERRFLRNLVVLASAVVIGAALSQFADVPNPDHLAEKALVGRLQAVFDQTLEGTPVEAAVRASREARLFVVERGGVPVSFLTHATPVDGGYCYGLRWPAGSGKPEIGRFSSGPICSPSAAGSFAGPPGRILPSETSTSPWFVPAIIALSTIGTHALLEMGTLLQKQQTGLSSSSGPTIRPDPVLVRMGRVRPDGW